MTRAGSAQTLSFTIDPLGGSDTVTVNGTTSADSIAVTVNADSTVAVNALKSVTVPTANVERLAIGSGQGADTVNVGVYDTVNAYLFVDAGEPTAANRNADQLVVNDKSGRAQVLNSPGGAVPGSGSVLVEYPRTTGTLVKIDYANVEKFSKR